MSKRAKSDRDESAVSMYLKDINNIPLLSKEEEIKIAQSAAEGNKQARDRLVNSNLRFVISIAKKYQGLGLPLEDLINEGNIGLITAADRFDSNRGCRFISYAVWWIRQSIIQALCEKSRMIRLPQNRATELIRIEKAKKMISKPQSFDEEIAEIGKLLSMDEAHIRELICISREMLSLECPITPDNSISIGDMLVDSQYEAPDKSAENELLKIEIENLLTSLDRKEAFIISKHYGIGEKKTLTLRELGELLNLSKERIRQIEMKAINRLQNPKRKEKLDMYVA